MSEMTELQFHDFERKEFISRIMTNCYVWDCMEKRLKPKKWFIEYMKDIFDVLDLGDDDLKWLAEIGLEEGNSTNLYHVMFGECEDTTTKIHAVHGLEYVGFNLEVIGIDNMPIPVAKKLYLIRAMRHVFSEFVSRCADYTDSRFWEKYVAAAAAWKTYKHFRDKGEDEYDRRDMEIYYDDWNWRFSHSTMSNEDDLPKFLASHITVIRDPELGYFLAPK